MELRGEITKEMTEHINQKIPKVMEEKFLIATSLNLSISLVDICTDSNLQGAIVCLTDAGKKFSFLQFTLFEALACLAWYRRFSPQSSEKEVIVTGKYYLDYATQLLYAIGEDISWFIIFLLNIEEAINTYFKSSDGKKKLKNMRLVSKMGKVGIYLHENMEANEITNIVIRLKNDPNWKKALKYRGDWVHNGPPNIKGLGNEFVRKNKICIDKNGNKVTYIGAQKQKYTIDQWVDITLHATEALTSALSDFIEIAIERKCEIKKFFINPKQEQQ
jgi:hypothetical protein